MVQALLLVLSVVGGSPESPPDIPVEAHDGVSVTDEQIRDVKSRAAKAYSGEIDRIYVGQLVHPFANVGFRVYFKDEIVGTYVTKRQFVLEITPANRKESKPSDERIVTQGNFLSRRVVPSGLCTHVTRLFPLKTARLSLDLPDNLRYSQAMALLQAIESKTYRSHSDEPFRRLSDAIDVSEVTGILSDETTTPIDMSKIYSLHYNEEANTIEVRTKEWR